MPSFMQTCPCQLTPDQDTVRVPIAYQDCCQPYHDALCDDDVDNAQALMAASAEQLMRTRYSAFVLLKPTYIVQTTLPAQQGLLDVAAIERWAQQTDWAGLQILTHLPKLGKRHAQVEFKAYFNSTEAVIDGSSTLQAHHEYSAFVKLTHSKDHERRWYFLDPTVAMTVRQKQPCLCGSGEKFKRCCGAYL